MLGTRGSNHLRVGTTVYDDIRNLLLGNIFGLKCNPYYFLCLSKIYAIWDSLPGFSQSSNSIYSSLIQPLAIGSGSCFPSEKISSTSEKVTFAITMKVPPNFQVKVKPVLSTFLPSLLFHSLRFNINQFQRKFHPAKQ